MKRKILAILLALSLLPLPGCDFLKDNSNNNNNNNNDSKNTDDTKDGNETEETSEIEETEAAQSTKRYKYSLIADKSEFILYDYDTLTTFTVSLSIDIESVTLTEKNSGTEYPMLDDGAYSEGYGGDDIANDGTYTASVYIDAQSENNFEFAAVVKTASHEKATNPVTVSVVAPPDESLAVDMNALYEDDDLLMYAATIKTSSDENEILEAKKNIVSFFEDLEKDGVISNLEGDETSGMLSFEFENGILGGYILDYSDENYSVQTGDIETSSKRPVEAALVETDLIEAGLANAVLHGTDLAAYIPRNDMVEYIVDEEDIVGNNKALILSSFPSSASCTTAYASVFNKLDSSPNYEFKPTILYDATVANYQTDLDDYGMIFIHSHGSFYSGDPIICLDEKVTLDNFLLYYLDIEAGRIIITGSVANGTGTYAVTPAFINYHYGLGALDNTLVYMCICQGFKSSTLVDSFINSGAGAVTAYTDTVKISYDDNIIGTYLDNLLAGKTVEKSMDEAIAAHGANDGDSTPAAFKKDGNKDLTIMQMGVVNGSFEEQMSGWYGVGDSRIISYLTDVYPTDKNLMAIISTGLGSAESSYGTEGSTLQQTFIVPDGAVQLVFDYNVVSEEAMEFVASSYDDYFFVTITDMAGGEEQLVYENVNASVWLELGGDYFAGGDDTTYHTDWYSHVFDISGYIGKCITLTFHTGDVGDSAYDTAGILDDIKIFVEK